VWLHRQATDVLRISAIAAEGIERSAMSSLVSVRTEELAGPALDWAINSIEGDQQPGTGQLQLFALPDAEQLITKYGVWVDVGHRHPWLADMSNDPFNRQPGETRTIAVFRAVVVAKRGATIKVPSELIQQ
jgi:hypothetical protein